MRLTKTFLPAVKGHINIIIAVLSVALGLLLVNTYVSSRSTENQPGAACEPLASNQPGEFDISLVVHGSSRRFKVALPRSYRPETPWPAIFYFHGSGGTIDDFRTAGPYTTPRRDDAIIVAPLGQTVHGGFGWDEACGGADMDFFDGMVSCVAKRFAVDPARISAIGFSWGGDFVNALGCCRGKSLRSIATIASGEMGTKDGYKTDLRLCQSPAPHLMSVRDPADAVYKPADFKNVLDSYRQLLKCGSGPPSEAGGCSTMSGCSRKLADCPIPGMGHAITPDASARATDFLLQE